MIKRITTAIIALWLSAPAALAQDQLSQADLIQLAVTFGVTTTDAKGSPPSCWPMYSAWSKCSIRTTCWRASSRNRTKSTERARRSGVTRFVR